MLTHTVPSEPLIRLSGSFNGYMEYIRHESEAFVFATDPLRLILGKLENIGTILPLTEHLGLTKSTRMSMSHDHVGFPPNKKPFTLVNAPYNIDTLLSNTVSLFTNWDNLRGDHPHPKNEHYVRHMNVIGTAVDGLVENLWYRRPGTPGSFVWANGFPSGRYHGFNVTYVNGRYGGSPSDNRTDGTTRAYMSHEMSKLASNVVLGVYDTYWGLVHKNGVYNFSSYSDPYSLFVRGISYDIFYRDTSDPRGVIERRVHAVHTYELDEIIKKEDWIDYPLPRLIRYDLIATPLKYTVTSSYTVTSNVLYDEDGAREIDPPRAFTSKTSTGKVYVQSYSSVPSSLGFDAYINTSPSGRNAPNERLRAFQHEVDAVMNDLGPIVFFSSKEAIDAHLTVIEANHLETLSDLSDLSSLVSIVPEFVRFLKNVHRKDAVGLVHSVLGILTSAKLLHSYGIAPTVKDAKELAAKGGTLYERIKKENILGEWTLHGKFTYELPDGTLPGFPTGNVVVARSKIRLSLNDGTLLAALLPRKAVGLLPTLANLWDLVPFSFVADWFVNIGGRLDNVDAASFLLAMDVKYCVHTISVHHTPSATDKTVYGFSTEGEVPGGVNLVSFNRFITTSAPGLINTRFDFSASNGPPDWGTAGSLVYKLVGKAIS